MKSQARRNLSQVGRRIGGRLFRYTFAFSLAAHLGLLGWLAVTHANPGSEVNILTGPGNITVHGIRKPPVVIPRDNLPPAPSIEPEEQRPPKGLPVNPGMEGAIPIPVDDTKADASTWDNPNNYQPSLPPGVDIIVNPGSDVKPIDVKDIDNVVLIDYSEPPVIVTEARPRYPDFARDAGVEGDVILLVYIDEMGRVRNALVQSSPGLPALEDEATKAAYKCTFKPARQQGRPVGVWYSIVMEFKL